MADYSTELFKVLNNADSGDFVPEILDENVTRDSINTSLIPFLVNEGVLQFDYRLVGTAGNSFSFTDVDNVSRHTIVEGVETGYRAISTNSRELTISGSGLAIQDTKESRQDVLRKLTQEFSPIIRDAIKDGMDEDIMSTILTSSNTKYVNDRANDNAVTATDVLTPSHIVDVATFFTTNNQIQGVGIVAPSVYGDLLKSGSLQEYSKAGDNFALRNGEVKELAGMPIAKSNYVTSVANSGSITVYSNVFLAKRALLFGWKLPVNITIEDDKMTLRSITTQGWTRYGVARKHLSNKRILVFKSA